MNRDRNFENLAYFLGFEHDPKFEDYETKRLRANDREYAQLISEQPCNRDVEGESDGY